MMRFLVALCCVMSICGSATQQSNQKQARFFASPSITQRTSCLTDAEWADVRMDDVLDRLNKTVTKMGSAGLAQLIIPTTDLEHIVQQQVRMNELLHNSQLRARMNELLQQLAACEADLLSYFESSSVTDDEQHLYFSSYFTSLNEYKRALDCSFVLDCTKAVVGLTSLLMMRGVNESIESSMFELKPKEIDMAQDAQQLIKAHARNQLVSAGDITAFINKQRSRLQATQDTTTASWSGISLQLDRLENLVGRNDGTQHSVSTRSIQAILNPRANADESLMEVMLAGVVKGLLSPFRDHDPRTHQFKDPNIEKLYRENVNKGTISFMRTASKITFSDATLGDRYYYWNSIVGLPAAVAGLFSGASTLTHDVFMIMQGKGYYDYLKQSLSKSRSIARKVKSCARYCATVRELAQLLSQNPAFASWQVTKQLQRMSDPEQLSLEMHKLLNLLDECSEQHEQFFLPGGALLAHRWLHNYATELSDVIGAVGMVDALVGVSTVVEQSSEKAPWCFVRFKDTKQPYLEARSFWCLLLAKQPVLNDLHVSDELSKLVITGPNGGGKSTVMKSIVFNTILAQSLGIACAHTWEQSLFERIVTSLDPKEDIARGLSSYMAQKQRMNQLQESLLQQTGPQLVIIDEPYRGTVQQTSEELLYDFCSSVADTQALMLLATHFEHPTLLAQNLPKNYSNYQCLFREDAQIGLVPTYQFAPGIASWWFHDEHQRSLYLQSLEKEISQR